MGNFYLKELKGDDLKKAWRRAFVDVQDEIKTEQQVCDFSCSLINKDNILRDDMQFRVYLIKDYSSTQSCVIFRISHALTDGVGSMLVAAAI